MSYRLKNLKKVDKNKVVLDLEIANNYLKKSLNAAYRDISEKAKIPGFRKGKIPYNIIDINFGKEYVLNEAASIAISELYPKIIEESNIKPIDYPKIKINKIGKEEPLDFEVTVEVEPEIDLPNYKRIEVTGLSEEVTDQEVEKQIDILRNNYATLEPVDEDKKIEKGDFVILDFEGKIDGEDFDGSSAQDYTLEVGSKTLFEDFENSLIGMKKGEHKNVTLTIPDNIANKDLLEKKAEFSIDIKEVKRKSLPELDELFLKNFGDYSSLEEFESYLKEKIAEQKKRMRRERMIVDILNNLVEKSKFDVPEPMINNRINRFKEDLERELKEHKISRSDYIKSYNLTEEQFNNNLRQSSIREIKEYLIFTALEKLEAKNIEPSEQQAEEEKNRILENYEKEEDRKKLQDFLAKPEGLEQLMETLKRKNLFDLLISNAKIKEEKELKTKKTALGKKLWTPKQKSEESNQGAEGKKLWVPDSK